MQILIIIIKWYYVDENVTQLIILLQDAVYFWIHLYLYGCNLEGLPLQPAPC